jgi:hypothetical protein
MKITTYKTKSRPPRCLEGWPDEAIPLVELIMSVGEQRKANFGTLLSPTFNTANHSGISNIFFAR